MKNYLVTKEQHLNIIAKWKEAPSHPPADHIIYNLLRGYEAKRGFGPITNGNKLANGHREWEGYLSALSSAKFKLAPRGKSTYESEEAFDRRIKAHREYLESLGIDANDEETLAKIRAKLQEAS